MYNKDEILANIPKGATHYDKYGNFYKIVDDEYFQWFDEWVRMWLSPLYIMYQIPEEKLP